MLRREVLFHRGDVVLDDRDILADDDDRARQLVHLLLVGRGMYALSEWGYKPGVVRDVIKEILKREGPMTKEDVVDKVLKERYLKKNTILVNLQNPKYFKKNKDKKYSPL